MSELHRRVFAVGAPSAPLRAGYRDWLSQVFLAHPDDGVRSLVYQDDAGAITGFIGAVPRTLSMRGARILAAVSSQFVVAPGSRGQLAGVALLRAFLSGPQDISIADEANASSARLWSALGGITAHLYSIHWVRPLRPFQLARSLLCGRVGLRSVAMASRPAAWIGDALAERIVPRIFAPAPPDLHAEPVSTQELSDHMPRFTRVGGLAPAYDEPFLRWAVGRLRRRDGQGNVHAMLVRNDRREPIGAYVYIARPGAVGEVLQIGATRAAMHEVLQHLFHHASEGGALALSGRFEPALTEALSDGFALLHRRGPYMLVHARRSELLSAFERGDAVFPRLEGEYCLRFAPVEPGA